MAVPLPKQPPTVEEVISSTAVAISEGERDDALLRSEAEKIVDFFLDEHPDVLLRWLRKQAVAIVRNQLRVRVGLRRRSRKPSAFDDKLPSGFARAYAIEGNRWRTMGKMRRPDWEFIYEDRIKRVGGSLFEAELARRIIQRLPDDDVTTRDALSWSDLAEVEIEARNAMERRVESIRRS